jgi:hypothetical protein
MSGANRTPYQPRGYHIYKNASKYHIHKITSSQESRNIMAERKMNLDCCSNCVGCLDTVSTAMAFLAHHFEIREYPLSLQHQMLIMSPVLMLVLMLTLILSFTPERHYEVASTSCRVAVAVLSSGYLLTNTMTEPPQCLSLPYQEPLRTSSPILRCP